MRCYLVALSTTLLVLLLVMSATVDAQSPIANQKKELRIMDCTLESKVIDDCNPTGYVVRLVTFSIPGIIIAVFLLLACPVYCMAKYCCNCCGGRNQTPNFCCPNTSLPARYSQGDILRPKIFAILTLLAGGGALGWGMVGGDLLVSGLNGLGDAITGVPSVLRHEIDLIDNSLVVTRYYSNNDTTAQVKLLQEDASGKEVYKTANDTIDELDALVSDNLGNYQETIDEFTFILYIIFSLPVGFVFLGCIAAVVNVRVCFPMFIVWFLFLLGFLLWLIHAVFSLLSMGVGDVCAEIHGVANKELNVISVLIQCDDSQFTDFRNNFKKLEISESEKTCEMMQGLCFTGDSGDIANVLDNLNSGRLYACPTNLNCTGKTFATVLKLMESDFYVHTSFSTDPFKTQALGLGALCRTPANQNRCYIALCTEDCTETDGTTLSTFGKQAKQAYFLLLSARQVSNTIDTLGARYSSCDSVLSIMISPFSPPCKETVDGLVYLRQSSGLVGLVIIAGIFVYAWGAKRFISLDNADKPILAGGSETEVEEMEA